MKKSEERQLIELLKMGDSAAVTLWYDRYQRRIQRFISTKVDLRQDAEELTHQTFLNCLKNLPLFLGNSSLLTWMLSIARHEVADYFRKKYAKKALRTLPLSEFLLTPPTYDAHDTSAKVAAVLQKMNAYSRELLYKKYVDCKKVAVIALEVGKSVKAVESELFRARTEFKMLYIKEK